VREVILAEELERGLHPTDGWDLSAELDKPFEVVHRRPRLTLVIVCGGRSAPHARATQLTVVALGRGRGPLKALLAPLFPPLMPSLVPWVAMSDGVSLLLLEVASLLPWAGQSMTT
jgi:hypothetical protein